MSVVDWEAQKLEAKQLLRQTLEKDFEFVGHSLSAQGFKNAIKKYLKAERGRLKAKAMAGKEICPSHIDPAQWTNLMTYWSTELQIAKTVKMVHARAHVKDYSTMGRKGRAGKELAVTQGRERSPGLTEIANGMQESQALGTMAVGVPSAVRSRLTTLESKQNDMAEKQVDMEGKMTQMLLNQSKNDNSMEEVKSMLKTCMECFSSTEGFNPSIGISSVEMQAHLGSTPLQVVAARSNTPFKTPAPPVSVHVTESSGDSGTPKHVVPPSTKAEEHTPSLQEESMEEALQSDDVNNDADPASTFTPAAASALVTLGAPRASSCGPPSKAAAALAVEDSAPTNDSVPVVVEEGVQGAVSKEEVKVCGEKGTMPRCSAADSKKPPRTRRLKKVVEPTKEDSPSLQKPIATPVVVELSASGSLVVAPRPLRTSPRKQKVPLKSPVEGSVPQEEESVKSKSLKPAPKSKPAQKKKSPAEKFHMGQEVYVLNPRNVKQNVATGIINGLGGKDTFHSSIIADSVYKLDITEAIWPQVTFMFPNKIDEQIKVKDAVGSCVLWEGKFLKAAH